MFFRRFYVKNSYCETDPFIVIAACCYVAAKAEESPVHIKTVVSEARMLFGAYPPSTHPSPLTAVQRTSMGSRPSPLTTRSSQRWSSTLSTSSSAT